MQGKTEKNILFDVKLNWVTDKIGVLSSNEVQDPLYVEPPVEFGGKGKAWTPEHLLLGAVSSCFMTTYLAFAQKLSFTITDISCPVIGQIKIVDGKYKFTNIDVYPEIIIANEALREKATVAMEKTHKYCMITNSLNADVFYHSQVVVAKPAENVIETSMLNGEEA